MTNIGVFLNQSAKFMAEDRPDIWDETSAFNTLADWHSMLNEDPDASGEISSGGFALTKRVLEDYIEYELHRKVVTFNIYPEENDTSVFNWTKGGQVVDVGLEVPDEEA